MERKGKVYTCIHTLYVLFRAILAAQVEVNSFLLCGGEFLTMGSLLLLSNASADTFSVK